MRPTVEQLRLLVGNPKALAIQQEDGQWVTIRRTLDALDLKLHLDGTHTIGTFLLRGDRARCLVLDVDNGSQEAAMELVKELLGLGVRLRSIGVEDSGNKGWHVWVLLARSALARDLRKLGLAAKARAGVACEVFPKQDEAKDLGNLVKLPGGIHRVTGRRCDFVTSFPLPLEPQVFDAVVRKIPDMPKSMSVSNGVQLPLACMRRIQDGVSEGARNAALFQLVVGIKNLAPEYLWPIVRHVNDKFDPPLSDMEVSGIVHRATQFSLICDALSDELHCGEDCVMRRKRA